MSSITQTPVDADIIPGIQAEPFPAATKNAVGTVNSVQTTVTSIYFSDKIMVTISQSGRLSQWIQVPLTSASPTMFDSRPQNMEEDLLPQHHLTPTTLIGGGGEARELLGHQYALQISNTISLRDPEESRTVIVGLGLIKVDSSREAFFDMMDLLGKVL